MWHNLMTCKIVYDRDKRLQMTKKRFDVPYPAALKENIISRNWKLLHQSMPAYEHQIAKAVGRNDLVSINHRTAAFMESYFDILFALNELTHPGEKRLISLCLQQCRILPERFEENLDQLFAHLFTDQQAAMQDIDTILKALKQILP